MVTLTDEQIVKLALRGFILKDSEVKRLAEMVAQAERRGAVKALRDMPPWNTEAHDRAVAIENGVDL